MIESTVIAIGWFNADCMLDSNRGTRLNAGKIGRARPAIWSLLPVTFALSAIGFFVLHDAASFSLP
ncbi:hypothetical protein [Mesorhizobium sp.]|uniref:hypothetical protein n=1 Tax=Mesorhizobium sp. TaxID=1871066 RepID=UPI000FE557F7|nr:hypothetical protein [Mesorhizobium sp.]RWG06073.1 MAG: hypothetical protein EOQ54_08705 [Mesorhizobium sp.]RWG97577.1 MAG: hypothetical protein EOQ72_18750 [Mesorhizobium sp.]TIN47757.1 MAG: hypothetical protein E5Y25_04685 [Mesorhizobium sp.]TIR91103.1 MAG: hypothetical protein E5X08_20375 [Mesorhizobium sp.]TIS04320.1 MAG: hypothetical protein E5X13_01915 [Mesorhizobium sp.]